MVPDEGKTPNGGITLPPLALDGLNGGKPDAFKPLGGLPKAGNDKPMGGPGGLPALQGLEGLSSLTGSATTKNELPLFSAAPAGDALPSVASNSLSDPFKLPALGEAK